MLRAIPIKYLAYYLIVIVISSLWLLLPVPASAEYSEEALRRMEIPVLSNDWTDWPQGPAISAKAAILMDADTGAILYSKNIHLPMYPASTTKLMTALLTVEHCSLDETIYLSNAAALSVPGDASSMGMSPGEGLTVLQGLYGILVQSANEVANALGEHISGSESAFAELMNEKALALGCLNTNFCNATGLNNDDHKTTAYDLAIIGRAFFQNSLLSEISRTSTYTIEPSSLQPDEIILVSKNLLYTGKTHAYPYLVGSKTGYLSVAGQTLVSCAQKDNRKLICVVLMEDTPYQYLDTISLFEYGFSNFYHQDVKGFVAGVSTLQNHFPFLPSSLSSAYNSFLKMNEESAITVPDGIDEDAITTQLLPSSQEPGAYSLVFQYEGNSLGSATLSTGDISMQSVAPTSFYVSVPLLLMLLLGFGAICSLLFMISSTLMDVNWDRRNNRSRKRRRKNESRNIHF